MKIEKKYIQIDVEAADCFEAIEMAAAPLVLDGKITEDYVRAACKREEEFPTGLPTVIGVAIPHAEPEFVKEEAIGLITLKKPVMFHGMGAPEEEIETSVVFLLAITDGERQIKMLQKIVLMIQDEMVLQKITGANSPEKIYNLINEFE
ncbi:MAG: PTS sugar transporter subunit IIA [Eubacterium sp.]